MRRWWQIIRLGEAEKRLEQPLDRGRAPQIGAAHDERDTAVGIIDHAGEMIGCGRVLAGEDDVVDVAWGAGETLSKFAPAGKADARDRLGRVEPPAVRLGLAPGGIVGQAAAGAWIMALGAVRCRERGGDVRAGAEARIDEAEAAKPLDRRRISRGAA